MTHGRARLKRAAAVACVAAVIFAGCGTRDEGGRQAQPSDGMQGQTRDGVQAVPLGTFAANAQAQADALEASVPENGERLTLVPATSLFPGGARLDPEITNPYSDAQSIAAGERHFAAFNCDGCHAPLGGGGMGPPLSDDVWIFGEEPAQIYLSIVHGRSDGMPAWGSMLPARTVWELVAYIQTLDEIDDYAAERGFDAPGGRFTDAEARGR